MSRLHWGLALLIAPLLAFALALPAGLDTTLSPAWAAALPFVWGLLIVTLAEAPSALFALCVCLPFSAWSLLYCSVWAMSPRQPAADALELLAAGALFMAALTAARFKRRVPRLLVAYAILIAGVRLQAALGPLAALALAACVAALASLAKRRPEARL